MDIFNDSRYFTDTTIYPKNFYFLIFSVVEPLKQDAIFLLTGIFFLDIRYRTYISRVLIHTTGVSFFLN